jgi:predicted dehydrogenase
VTTSNSSTLKGVGIGAGYFSHYQYEAWSRIPAVTIAALYNRTPSRGREVQQKFGIPKYYADYREMIVAEQPDFVDVITPPETHLEMCTFAANEGVNIICQKPLAPDYREARRIVEAARERGVRFMVHENWRWQPWYREIKKLLDADELGDVFSIYFRMRTGDGWGEDAYAARQPFFRDYPRLLIYETGCHFLDTFRFLLGEIETVYARLQRLNPIIKGEDSAQVVLTFTCGATAILDGNRYNENEAADPRYTFGEMRIDASKGHLELGYDGSITIKSLGKPSYRHDYTHKRRGFAGDCVYALQRHFVDCLLSGEKFESTGEDYLRTARAVEACYESAATGQPVCLSA